MSGRDFLCHVGPDVLIVSFQNATKDFEHGFKLKWTVKDGEGAVTK